MLELGVERGVLARELVGALFERLDACPLGFEVVAVRHVRMLVRNGENEQRRLTAIMKR